MAFAPPSGADISARRLQRDQCRAIYREVKVNAIGGGSEEIMKTCEPGDGAVSAVIRGRA